MAPYRGLIQWLSRLCPGDTVADSLRRTSYRYHYFHRLRILFSGTKGCEVQPVNTAIISPTSPPRASNIPLQSIQSIPSDSRSTHSAKLLESSEKGSRRSSHSSARSVGSDFSIWSDTGDLAEQFAEAEDPLQIHLRNSSDRHLLRRKERRKQPKHVHYPSNLSNERSGVDIEKIRIPNPPPRHISRVERVLAAIMTPRNEPNSQMHGLVGKPLL